MAAAMVVVVRHPARDWGLRCAHRSLHFACGLIFGFGLLISGMVQPAKVLGFLDIFGAPGTRASPS